MQEISLVKFNPERNYLQEGFEVWHEMSSPLFDSSPFKKSNPSIYSASIYQVTDLIFTNVSFDILKFKRTYSHLRQDCSNYFVLQYYQQGKQIGYLDNDLFFENNQGIISLQDLAHGYTAIGKSRENYGLIIPRHLILTHDQPYICWSTNSPEGYILLNTFSTIWHELSKANQQEIKTLNLGFLGLLNGLLTAKSDPFEDEQLRQVTFRSVKDYLLANLENLDLDVDFLCKKFYCSRSKLYRIFKDVGGVKTFLRNERLRACFQELEAITGSDNELTKVSDIASKYGFWQLSNFTRMFKKKYGISPSELANTSIILNPTKQRKAKDEYEDKIKIVKSWFEGNYNS